MGQRVKWLRVKLRSYRLQKLNVMIESWQKPVHCISDKLNVLTFTIYHVYVSVGIKMIFLFCAQCTLKIKDLHLKMCLKYLTWTIVTCISQRFVSRRVFTSLYWMRGISYIWYVLNKKASCCQITITIANEPVQIDFFKMWTHCNIVRDNITHFTNANAVSHCQVQVSMLTNSIHKWC